VGERGYLSAEAEREEVEARTKFRMAEGRLRQLHLERQGLLDRVHKLAADQKAIYDRRLPMESRLEALHHEHRVLGRRTVELRSQRDAARRKAEEALVQLRIARSQRKPEDRLGPQQLRREMARLEERQQTMALPIAEENALIDQIRELSHRLKDAEQRQDAVVQQGVRLKTLEDEWKALRETADRLGAEAQAARVGRDEKMAAMQAVLVEVGQAVAETRSLGRARGEAMDQLEVVGRQIRDLEREMDRLHAQSRARRDEARRAIREYAPRRRPSESALVDSAADAQLQELLRRGKVTLGG
jgi:uncharacterized coiled-coil DUF342 family protein